MPWEARSRAAQVSQEVQQAALIIPGDCITSALFWFGFLFPTFNLNRRQQSVARSPKLHFVTLGYIALLTVRRPHALSKCKHTSPSVALHESAAWNVWHFIPLIFLCAYLKNFVFWRLVRIPQNCRGACTPPKSSCGPSGSVKHPARRLQHQLRFQLLLFNLLYYSIL